MNAGERTRLLHGYARLLTSAWSSRRFTELLDDDPRSALARCGLNLPPGASIRVLDEADLDPDAIVAWWENGFRSGTFVLSVPSTPQPGAAATLAGRATADLDLIVG